MTKGDKTRYLNRSTDTSKDPIDKAIREALSSEPMRAGSLKARVVESTKCSDAQYHKRLAVLRDDTKAIAFVQSGRDRYYALSNQTKRLAPYLKKRGELEQYVIASARDLRDYLMREAAYDSRNPDLNSSIHIKFSMFIDAIAMLRESYPGLPRFKLPNDESESEMEKKWHAIRAYHSYLLEVLEFFKQ
jgi:hypothetical protein